MAELTPQVLKRRARLGIVWLAARTGLLQLIVLGGTVMLARLLEPRDFGIYAIVQFTMTFFMYFGDAGLGAALIQKKTTPSQRELSSVFYLQLGVALVLVAIVGLGAELMRYLWSDLPAEAVWLMRVLSLGLVLTMLRVIPAILMERELLFGRLSAVDVAGSVSFYFTAVTLAWLDFGVWALVVGSLAQGLVSTALALVLRPWRPQLVFDRALLAPIIKFGLPFQLKNIIGVANGAVSPVYAGAMLGPAAVGFINWAQSTAYFPLKLVEIMGRVTFPLYSRLQDDKALLAETLGRSIFICATGTLFFTALFTGIGPELVHVVFTDKWQPAVPLLYIYAGAISIGFLGPIVASALDASGKPQIFAKLALAWTALNWAIVAVTTPLFGMLGFAAGYSVHVVVGNIVVLFVLARVIPGVRVWRRFVTPLVSGAVTFGVFQYCAHWITGVATLIGVVALGLATFAAVLWVIDRRSIYDAIALVPSSESEGERGDDEDEPVESVRA